MKRKYLVGLLVSLFCVVSTTTAFAANLVTYEYTLTGGQLMSYITANGADGSTALDNGIYDGARKFNDINDLNGDGYTSYNASLNTAFTNWTNSGDRMTEFNLWGYDGLGANWGEIYKVNSWGNESPTSNNANWDGFIGPWPSSWGSPPDNNEGQLIGWYNGDIFADGLGFDGAGSTYEFTFQVTLDMDDPAFYGLGSPWHNGVDGQMVFWFGGWTINDALNTTGRYQGNIVLQGSQVPLPAAMWLFGSGLVGLAGFRTRRRKNV